MNEKTSISWPAVLAFLALAFALAEMHELVHTNIGYLFGGCYGERDFNVWGLCEASNEHPLSYWSTLSGPIFTFAVMWLGYIMIRKASSIQERTLGLAILFASMPFSRIITILLQSGDEYMVMRNLFNNGERDTMLWLLTTGIILVICAIPLIGGYMALPKKRRLLTFLILFIAPTFIFVPIVIMGLNPLLLDGMMAGPGLLGAPIMITVWFAICVGITYWKRESLRTWITSE